MQVRRDLDKNSFESKGWNLESLLLNESACLEGFDRKPSELRLGLMQNDILYYLLAIRRRISASSFGCVIMTIWPFAMACTFHPSLRALAAKGSIHDERGPMVQ